MTHTFRVTIPDDKAEDFLLTVTNYLRYQDNIPDPNQTPDPMVKPKFIPNPQTRREFLNDKVLTYLKECYKAGKAYELESQRKQAIIDASGVSLTVQYK